ncbi:MAG: tRNA (adenosine(37)-N6)-threonylcarbamoyltransferase complex transferase subunit TsaD [Patescibacteria group bacterium]
MIILGIETSCDDTGIAIIEAKPTKTGPVFNILSNVVSSQIKVHAPFGGVVPNLAAREHLKNIGPCLKTALKEANKTIEDIDLIAVTSGPGLIPSLLIGVNFAKALAYKYNIPIVPINHLEGHITIAFGNGISKSKSLISKNTFPAIALLVSGGHTQLILMKKIGSYKIIGETRDDAAGECFDKTAKLLGLEYPGGPAISREAEKWKSSSFAKATADKAIPKLPRPMMNQNNFDFSFSGLKTAVLYLVRDVGRPTSNMISAICRETQQAIIDVLISKTFKAVEKYKAKTIILSGGVAANEELRKQFAFKIQNSKLKIQFLTPVKNLCMDNGTMIAMAGYYNRNKATKKYSSIIANTNLRLS